MTFVIRRFVKFIGSRSKKEVAIAGILLAAFVGWVDKVTGIELSVGLLYLVPVILTAWFVGRGMGIAVSLQCAIEGFVAGTGGVATFSNIAIPYWNAGIMFGFYFAVTCLLVALKHSLDREEKAAREIQERLLPDTLDLSPATTIVAAWKPSIHVGGDYFDVFPLGHDRIGFCIADVSGHGIPAALLMSNVQSAVRLLAVEFVSPADLCARLNTQAATSFPDSGFLTFCVGVLHIPTGQFTYSNAGHNPPIILHAEGNAEVLRGGGVPLGTVKTWSGQEASIPLKTGDMIVLYTDGVTEARNFAGELFGEERLVEVLLNNRSHEPDRIKESVLKAVELFSQGNLDDDLTLLCVSLSGDPGARTTGVPS